MNRRYVFWIVVAVLVVAPFAAGIGALAATQAAIGTEETWVYEECTEYDNRRTRCRELDEPRLEENPPGAAIGAVAVGFLAVFALVATAYPVLERRILERRTWRESGRLTPSK